jgi:DNA-binding NarL/FixJ family response regulator
VNGHNGHEHRTSPTTVLVAVRSPQVREALVALIGSLDGFCVVGETGNDEHALELARSHRPRLAVVDQELPGCDAGWTIQMLQHEGLAEAIVAIGRRADGGPRAHAAGARAFVQMGAPPCDVLSALWQAISDQRSAIS